jgi:hypothetical protein
MIRLRAKYSWEFIERFFNTTNYENAIIEFYIQSKISAFGYNWRIITLDGSFWMGAGHNSEQRGANTHLYIEYNPNKLGQNEFLKRILKHFFSRPRVEIISVDIAKDVYLPISNFIVDMASKREIKIFNTTQGKTIYVGKGDGRAKVYDKAKEQGLKGVDWTRFEVSLKIEKPYGKMNIFAYGGNLPSIFMVDDNIFIDAEERAVLHALRDNVVNLNDFTRRKKDKYKVLLEGMKEIVFDSKEIYVLLNDYVKERGEL